MNKITPLVGLAFIAAFACSTSKQTAPSPTAMVIAKPPAKPASGIYAPGEEELTAIKTRLPQATLPQLNEGYLLYAKGACVNCHEAKAIYQYGEEQWGHIVDDMAAKAELKATQKEAVMNYILAIKATKPGSKG